METVIENRNALYNPKGAIPSRKMIAPVQAKCTQIPLSNMPAAIKPCPMAIKATTPVQSPDDFDTNP